MYKQVIIITLILLASVTANARETLEYSLINGELMAYSSANSIMIYDECKSLDTSYSLTPGLTAIEYSIECGPGCTERMLCIINNSESGLGKALHIFVENKNGSTGVYSEANAEVSQSGLEQMQAFVNYSTEGLRIRIKHELRSNPPDSNDFLEVNSFLLKFSAEAGVFYSSTESEDGKLLHIVSMSNSHAKHEYMYADGLWFAMGCDGTYYPLDPE